MFTARKGARHLILLLLCLFTSSCSSLLTSTVIVPAFDNLQEQSDLLLVCEGTPSYLLMLDSLIASKPENTGLLSLGCKAYAGYIGAMLECGSPLNRVEAMADKANTYRIRLLNALLGISPGDDYQLFSSKLEAASQTNAEELFWAGFAWITWVRQQEGAPAAMADLGKIEQLLHKVIELDETIQSGSAHFLLGGYYGSRPAMFGGDPSQSRYHFERALQISRRTMLIVQTTYAETYCRTTMNKDLHDALLLEVMDFQLHLQPGNMLANQIAQRRAKRLLQEQFFEE
ncbi:MAG: TRAP transporter TatT component family protein [Desulfopila sp.]|jgi:hypothetical protein|nr:TRAP transporter TatT component family protein [Desulfopila sp.]